MVLRYTAGIDDTGRTVYSILRREFMLSAALLRKLKKTDGVMVSGQPVYVNYIVKPGEIVTADISAAEPTCDNVPERGALEILFENEGLLAVNKPAGVLVHPSRAKHTGTLANFVAGYLEEKTGDGRCHAVNRLDRDTSGVVLFAKNSYMKARASAALAAPGAVKEYIALVYGEASESGTVDVPIRRMEERNMLRIPASDGQRAVTRFRRLCVIETASGKISLLRLSLETGRTHQIRVHMLYTGHPVLGDTLYRTDFSQHLSGALGLTTQALHAAKLEFCEPLSRQVVIVFANPPDNFGSFLTGQNMENVLKS